MHWAGRKISSHFDIMAILGGYGLKYDQYWYQFEEEKRKALEIFSLVKTKPDSKLWSLLLYFWLRIAPKWSLHRKHFQLAYIADLYVFRFSRARRMGKDTELNSKLTFSFYGPMRMLCTFLLICFALTWVVEFLLRSRLKHIQYTLYKCGNLVSRFPYKVQLCPEHGMSLCDKQ